MIFFSLTIFFASFLLFFIELAIAKIFLPVYGGSYYVWGACVVFFQGILLAGYAFPHLAINKTGIIRYRYIYLVLFLLAFFSLPQGMPQIHIQPGLPVVIDIFIHLAQIIGLSFFLLSSVSVSLQAWVMHTRSFNKRDVYSLYASSNFGSFLALAAYPLYIESHYTLIEQLNLWRAGFIILIGLIFILFVFTRVNDTEKLAEAGTAIVPSRIFSWIALSAVGTILFLSSTNILTQEIAPVPLLWVIPLAIYLFTFVLVFRDKPFNPPFLNQNIHVLLWTGIFIFLLCHYTGFVGMGIYAGILFVFLFLMCLFVNNELYRSRPPNRADLTFFYVMLSLGGFLGGILVSWIMPVISVDFMEFPVGICLVAVVLIINTKDLKQRDFLLRMVMFATIIIFKGCYLLLIGVEAVILYYSWRLMAQKANWAYAGVLFFLFVFISIPNFQKLMTGNGYIFQHRNYYGIIRVLEKDNVRLLIHGSTIHGGQYRDPKRQNEPLIYYNGSSPAAEIMKKNPLHLESFAVIGLGVGSLAAYTFKDQSMDFYELDPDVYTTALKYFTYLHNARGSINYIFGDARLSLGNSTKMYDAIIIDAFGGDAIPVHLITVEAIAQYRRHLNPGGVLLFHFSNIYLDLLPVIAKNAWIHHAYFVTKDSQEDARHYISSSKWAVLTWDKSKWEMLKSVGWQGIENREIQGVKPWTDQFSDIFPYIRLNSVVFQKR